MGVSLRGAAKTLGVTVQTLRRGVQRGRLSKSVMPNGTIDPVVAAREWVQNADPSKGPPGGNRPGVRVETSHVASVMFAAKAASASYGAPLLKYLVAEGIGFTISADMTKELRERCLAVPSEGWVEFEDRGRERVDIAEVEFAPGDWPKDALPLRYVVVRFTPLQEELFETMTPKHLAIVSNRAKVEPGVLVRWHWQKAGTIEHVHRVMKDELGAGVMPSGRFGANAAWFRINALTFNVLTVLKRRALPERLRDARPKRLRFEWFTLPGKLTVHQGRLSVRTSARAERLQEVIEARGRLLAMHQATRDG